MRRDVRRTRRRHLDALRNDTRDRDELEEEGRQEEVENLAHARLEILRLDDARIDRRRFVDARDRHSEQVTNLRRHVSQIRCWRRCRRRRHRRRCRGGVGVQGSSQVGDIGRDDTRMTRHRWVRQCVIEWSRRDGGRARRVGQVMDRRRRMRSTGTDTDTDTGTETATVALGTTRITHARRAEWSHVEGERLGGQLRRSWESIRIRCICDRCW